MPQVPASTAQKAASKASPPTIVDYTRLATMYDGNTSPNFCASVHLPSGDHGSVEFSAARGSFSTTIYSASGSVQRCSIYAAPDSTAIKQDTLMIYLFDNTTNLSAKVEETVQVRPQPSRPS